MQHTHQKQPLNNPSSNRETLDQTNEEQNNIDPTLVYNRLDHLGLSYKIYEHDPIFTVEEGLHLHKIIPGGHCKNLFLKDKKGQYFLISALEDTKIDLKLFPKLVNSARVSFGSPERLWECLKVLPGSVTPFALLNDTKCHVQPILDHRLFDYNPINFHPLVNTCSVTLDPQDLLTYIKSCGHQPKIMDLNGLSF